MYGRKYKLIIVRLRRYPTDNGKMLDQMDLRVRNIRYIRHVPNHCQKISVLKKSQGRAEEVDEVMIVKRVFQQAQGVHCHLCFTPSV